MPLFSRRDRALVPVGDDNRRSNFERNELALFDPFGDDFFGFGASRAPRGMNLMENVIGQMFADPFEHMGMGGLGAMVGMGGFGSMGGMQMNQVGMGGNGVYQSQTMMMSTTIGPDGQPKVEKYASTAAGNSNRRMFEVQEMYSNSETGVDKMALERDIAGRGRRVVKERNRHNGSERVDDEVKGMQDSETHAFDREWEEAAAVYLPRRHGMRSAIEQVGRASDRVSRPLLTSSAGNASPQSRRQAGSLALQHHDVESIGNGDRNYESFAAPRTYTQQCHQPHRHSARRYAH